jgi:FKBP-type peptidyl-prolyl cis-trans isomerase
MTTRQRMALFTGLSLSLAMGVIAYGQRGNEGGASNLPLNTKNISYAIGYDIGRKYQQQEITINPNQLAAGLKHSLTDAKPRMSEKQIDRMLEAFRQRLMEQRRRQREQQASEQSKAGDQFLKKNAKKPGVQVTDSGLQYKVLEEGSGESPGPQDRVTVHYTGKLLSGKVFDSSRKRGQPATFGVNQVIPGWTEALQLMKPGAKYRLWIPSELAYGKQGAGETIKPGATLMFTVELLKVSK